MNQDVLAPVRLAAEKLPALFKAEGFIQGRLDLERNVLLGMDRQIYPATVAPALRRWIEKHPDEARKRFFFRVFPRSLKGDRLRFYVAEAPSCAREDLPMVPHKFVVSGVVLNQRSLSTGRSPDHVVVRVKPNHLVPPEEKHRPENKAHLLFLRGRVVPAAKFLGKHVTFMCELSQGELWIRGCSLAMESSVERFTAGAAVLPWPFRDRNSSTWEQIHRWNQLQAPFPEAPDAREGLLESLKAWRHSATAQLQRTSDLLLRRDLDRQMQVAARVHTLVEAADQNKLHSLVTKRGLVQLMDLITAGTPAESGPKPLTLEPSMTTATAPRPTGTTDQQLLEMLGDPVMDELILWTTKLTRPQLIQRIKLLWASGQITPEIQSRSRSYQLNKHKPKG
jgi:hypothetical protein